MYGVRAEVARSARPKTSLFALDESVSVGPGQAFPGELGATRLGSCTKHQMVFS